MGLENRVLFDKGLLPISVGELCTLLNCDARLVNVSPEAMITCISYGESYEPLGEGFLLICGPDDSSNVRRMGNGGTALLTKHEIEGMPCIITEDVDYAVLQICTWMYNAIMLPSVVVSGSVGKTTTKRMVNMVLRKATTVFSTNQNHNMLKELCCYLQSVHADDQMLVWEVCENLPKDADYSSRALRPSIAVITNAGDSHLGTIIGGKEALLKSFQSITAGMGEDGVVIFNADDPDSRQIVFDRKTISVGIADYSADCVAYNITDTRKGTSFDLRFQDQVTHIDLFVFGTHNVYNAMMAFIVGALQGVDRKTIAKALRSYRNVGFRQNILRFGGVVVYADCYNASAKSVSSAIQCFCGLPGIQGKRIAVLGDISEIEGYEEQTYREIAEAIDASTIDILVTYGNKSAMIRDYVTRDIEMLHCANSKELDETLNIMKRRGKNAYLLKGSRAKRMETNLRSCFPWHYYPMRALEKFTIKYRWGE